MVADEAAAPLVSVEDLSKRLGGRQAVDAVTLQLSPGEVLGFVGPNGAGKTTTLRLLAGLLRPDRGAGQVLGQDIRHRGRAIAERVGYMPQRLALYDDLSVADNLRFRADLYRLKDPRARIAEVLLDFGLQDRRHQRTAHLSGGWARRLQLAATLIHEPPLVMLDEPTAGLDAESKQDVWRRILQLGRGGAGVVVNTHDLAEAEQCTRVVLFDAGRIKAQGPPAEVAKAVGHTAFLAAAPHLDRLRAKLEALPGVVALETQDGRLRVLCTPDAAPALRAACEAMGAMVELTGNRLADAAFPAREGGAA